jgi:pimeloyl-ACP methyl ester carboxylesterase
MPRKKTQPRHATPLSSSAFEQAWSAMRAPQTPPPTVSALWLLKAASLAILAAAICAWLTLCLLFWQGSWQLLYHPASTVARTPASAGLPFDPVGFAATEAGETRLKGWWIPASNDSRYARYTVLYLHSQDGNLSDAVDDLAALHAIGVNVLAFDYRGYGQSQFAHPSEARWREDAEWALHYLTATRNIAAGTIILDGSALGANLALEIGAQHPELAGVVLSQPLTAPVDAIFRDPRAKLVPAHLLVRDRYDADSSGAALHIPSLWLIAPAASTKSANPTQYPAAYNSIAAQKMLVWLPPSHPPDPHFADAYSRWLDDLPAKTSTP